MTASVQSHDLDVHGRDLAAMAYQPALDGVRAVSVTLVLLFHAGFGWMSGGYVGVSVFFTLSGFLITSLALAEWGRSGRLDVGAFYARRVRRLMPASLLCIGAVVVAAFAGQFHGVADLRRDIWGALAQVFNWVTLAAGDGYAEQMSRASGQRAPLDHYWSLAVEEQFYWVWPLALIVILRGGRRGRLAWLVGLLTVAVAATVAISTTAGASATYLATPARLPEILGGCLLAVALHGRAVPRPAAWLAVAALGVVVWAAVTWPADHGPAYSGWMPAFAVASVALIAGLQADSPLRRALSASPLVGLGRISYGVYLFHWPVYTLVDERRLDIARPALFAIRVAITLAVALASFRLLESPVRAWRAGWRRSVSLATAGCVLAAAVVVAMPDSNGSFTYASASTRRAAAMDEVADGASLQPLSDRPARVYVVGDSTAYALGEGMIEWAADHPDVMKVSQGASIGCGLNPTGALPDDAYKEACERNVGRMPERIEMLRPDVVIAMVTLRDMEDRQFEGEGVLTMDDEAFLEHLSAGYQWLTQGWLDAGAGLVLWVLPPQPDYPREGAWATILDPERQNAYRSVILGLADRIDGVVVTDLAAWMSEQDDPPARDDGLHFSPSGAEDVTDRFFAPLLADLLTP